MVLMRSMYVLIFIAAEHYNLQKEVFFQVVNIFISFLSPYAKSPKIALLFQA